MISMIQIVAEGLQDNRPSNERNPLIPRELKCERPQAMYALLEDFYKVQCMLDAKVGSVEAIAARIFYRLEMINDEIKGRDDLKGLQFHIDEIEKAADELYFLVDK